jgi:membrane protein implicated in regulation of membrane protease activity
MVRRAIFLLLLVPSFGLFISAAQADQKPDVLYQATSTSTQEELDLLIPKNLDPGFQSIILSVTGPNQVPADKTLYFCKTLTGAIDWNNVCPDATVMISQSALNAIHLRSKLPKYNPRSEPKKTTDLVIASLAALTVASSTRTLSLKPPASSSSKQEGYLSGVAKGGLLLSTVLVGPGDKLRGKKTKESKSGSRFTASSSRISANSPLLSRILADGNYLRATLQHLALLLYPFALGLGFFAAKSINFQAMPPSTYFMIAILTLGIFDSLAGGVTIVTFGLLALVTGHVQNLSSFLTLVGIGLVGFSPILLASVFRPLRRSTVDFTSYWERFADYLVASILTGWVVKQIVQGLSGLSGLQLPITAHAHLLGIIAGILVAVRYGFEDLVSYLYPSRMQAIEPNYQTQSPRQYGLRIVMQIFVFLLVAEPFFGDSASLWIGLSIFTIPLILSLFESRFPKSKFLSRWIPKGIIEMITMTTAGYLIARVLNWYPQSATGYVLTAFILLGIPGFILKILPLFADESSDEWRESKSGKVIYRVGGLIALLLLSYIITTGLLLSNNL